MGFIYIIKNNINNKCYVGQTRKTISERWNEHLRNTSIRHQAIYNAMNKYGICNFYVEELESVDDELLNEREIYWIENLNTLCPNGYNMTSGGDFGDSNPMFNPEIAKKVSKYFIGDNNPSKRPEVKEKIRASAVGRIISDETRKKMSENNGRYWLGKHLPPEQVKHYTENHWCLGKFGSLNPNSKSVNMVDMKTKEIIKTFGSMSEAAKWLNDNGKPNATMCGISHCCTGLQKSSYGYIWSYIETCNDYPKAE